MVHIPVISLHDYCQTKFGSRCYTVLGHTSIYSFCFAFIKSIQLPTVNQTWLDVRHLLFSRAYSTVAAQSSTSHISLISAGSIKKSIAGLVERTSPRTVWPKIKVFAKTTGSKVKSRKYVSEKLLEYSYCSSPWWDVRKGGRYTPVCREKCAHLL